MKLYRAKIPQIAKDVVETLVAEGDVEILPENREEAEQDLIAIMEEFRRRDMEMRNRIKDHMAHLNIPYDEYGRARKKVADEMAHPTGDDIERFLARQFVENLMISRFIEEVFSDDRVLYKKVIGVVKGHDVDERAIRDEAVAKVQNVQEGTVDYEIALQNAMKDVKKRRGLI